MSRYVIAAGLVALAAAIYAAVGLLEPARLGWTAPVPTWMKIGLVVLLALPIVWLLAFRHQLQSQWALSDESPVTMYANVEVEQGTAATAYYVCLRTAPAAPVLHRLAIERPHGNVDVLREPQAARVFIDSGSGKPLVVEFHGHRLWTVVA
ncbi:MAG TPA: hypothetical protein VFJ70_14500 [Burkholderiales bacterium]|nr:hypothetical protein [Burkholderiales bacterium]